MPVTFSPASHSANQHAHVSRPSYNESQAIRIFNASCQLQRDKCKEILQSSFNSSKTDHEVDSDVIAQSNGFVGTAVEAYNQHRGLVIRPDHVWLAILVQFTFFMNANAEDLRKSFVGHDGRKELEVTATGSRYTVDFGSMARQMTKLMEENIVDPTVRDWIMPNFSTTTPTDSTVCSIIMMASMKAYFSFKFSVMCVLLVTTITLS